MVPSSEYNTIVAVDIFITQSLKSFKEKWAHAQELTSPVITKIPQYCHKRFVCALKQGWEHFDTQWL